MKKIAEQSEKNNGNAYDDIYVERVKKGQDNQDIRRWIRLMRYFKGGDLADLGCLDSGIVDFIINKPNSTYTGLDLASEAMRYQRLKYKEYKNVFFMAEDLYNTPFQDGAFDYVVLGEVLEHLDEPQAAINEAMRILRDGGTLAISTPLEEEKEIGAIDKERHIWSFSEEDIRRMVSSFGPVVTARMGSQYFPVYKYAWPTLFAYVTKK